ncbi:hypothetical protein ACFFHM_15645 [Halalkalibacter kiskunsagensis]|uniref:Uncharacterized protein n=1 Tax=Halalkalibacter kiskunsagensis TaxID=1548599 RepID=A0ABV6KF12_9BACI
MGNYRLVGKVAGEVGITMEQAVELVDRIKANKLYKRDKQYVGNPVILLGFLLTKIKLNGQLNILDEVLEGKHNEESLSHLNNMSYKTYVYLTA